MLADRMEEPPTAESVQAVIAARLDALPAEEKLLLQEAAVVGMGVWPGVLVELWRPVAKRRRTTACASWCGRSSSRASNRRQSRGSMSIRFRHALVRDEAYRQIPRLRKIEIHRRTAEWLESLSPDRTSERSEMLALHYMSAYENALAANADAGSLVEGARISLRDAGDRALAPECVRGGGAPLPGGRRSLARGRSRAAVAPAAPGPLALLRVHRRRRRPRGSRGTAPCCGRSRVGGRGGHGPGRSRESARANRPSGFSSTSACARRCSKTASCHARRSRCSSRWPTTSVWRRRPTRRSRSRRRRSPMPRSSSSRRSRQARSPSSGSSRGLLGDAAGREDLERSIEIAERIDSSLSSLHCGMLADLEGSLGNLGRCFELQERARGHAQRFGHASHIQWYKAERVSRVLLDGPLGCGTRARGRVSRRCRGGRRALHGGLLPRHAGTHPPCERRHRSARWTTPRRALALARESNQLQMLYPALAFQTRALAMTELHTRQSRRPMSFSSPWSSQLRPSRRRRGWSISSSDSSASIG